jgi:Rieske Fe-S protein
MSDESVPKWRADFPFTAEGEDEVTRREFVRYLTLASGAFAVANVGVAAWTSVRPIERGTPRAIVALGELAVGEARLFRYPTPADPAILVRLPDDRVVAFSQKCTHLGCVVYWEARRGQLLCPCHDGVFDGRDGRVVAGPPQRPLERIAVEVRSDGMVWAIGRETT